MIIKTLNLMNKCPKCGLDNHCAIANHKDPSICWCMTLKIPQEVIEKIKEKYMESGCLCRSCLKEEIDLFNYLISKY